MHRSEEDIASGRKLYVGNLDPEATSSELDEIFRRYGKVINIWVARNPPGFAFVTFEDSRDARDAVEAMDGVRHREKCIRVEVAKGPGARGRRGSPGGMRPRGWPEAPRGGDRRRSPGGYNSEGSDFDRRDRGDPRRGRSRSRSYDRRRSYSPRRRNASVDSRGSRDGRDRRR